MKAIGSLQFGFYGTTSFTAIFHRHFISLDFHAYASSGVLPPRLQGLIPGLWLAATRAGLTPARTHDIAMSLLIFSHKGCAFSISDELANARCRCGRKIPVSPGLTTS